MMKSHRLLLIISALALLSLLAAACGGAATPTRSPGPTAEASLPASPEPEDDHHASEGDHHSEDDGHHADGEDHHEGSAHHDDNNGAEATEPIAGAPEVRIVALEFGYEPSTVTLEAGQPVNIVLVNEGAVEHDIVAYELGLHLHVEGDETAVAGFIPQEPGTYDFACSIPGHEEAGMTGQFVVK